MRKNFTAPHELFGVCDEMNLDFSYFNCSKLKVFNIITWCNGNFQGHMTWRICWVNSIQLCNTPVIEIGSPMHSRLLSIQTVVPTMWKNACNVNIHSSSFINVEGNINYNAVWNFCLQCTVVQSPSMIPDTATWTFVKRLVSCHQKSVFWNPGILKASKVRFLVHALFSPSNVLPLQSCYTIRSYIGYHLFNFVKGSIEMAMWNLRAE